MSMCVRAECLGSYLEDGSCDECGFVRPGPATSPPAAPVPSGSARSAVSSRSSRSSGRTTPGAIRHRGLVTEQVELPSFVPRNPADAVLTDPQVPYRRRICPKCEEPVGQPRGDRPGLVEGFCPRDRLPFSYKPALEPGQRLDRYEVLGCLAYGGFGWIYLARDRNLGDEHAERWVVLKGLINQGDPDSVAAAVNERRFLVGVDHPNIVKIHDFVRHTDPRSGTVTGYIVMEYLGGRTLRDMFQRNRDDRGELAPLPVPVVLKYADEILGALGYLHRRGLLYCDLKPENVMQVEQQVKLIDLGAVLSADGGGSVYGTEGYQAPEVEDEADPRRPAPDTDLYTLGRTMAVLSFPFAGFTGTYRHKLPDPAEVEVLAAQESFHRLLKRAAHADPRYRFQSAEDLRDQVSGVLAEVLAAERGEPESVVSTLFTRERRVFGTGTGVISAAPVEPVTWADVPLCLPSPLVDPADPEAGFLATLGSTAPDRLVETLLGSGQRTPEVLLRLVDAHIAAGDVAAARADLDEFTAAVPEDWRSDWYGALAAFADADPEQAAVRFDAVYAALPGELAAKLALAAAAEWHGDTGRAERLYARVWSTDDSYVSAAFGLARTLLARGERAEAVTVLDGVPDSSTHHVAARVAAVRALIGEGASGADLEAAADRLGGLDLDTERAVRLSIEVLTASLAARPAQLDDAAVRDNEENRLRAGLEENYRRLAKLTTDRDLRSRLVDRANEVRPKTLV
ncbi:serine/threonine-protein kinase [Amycolatopsis nigrescens]|uniref:serine/threonine-protein kinase n=1 Tax=Amycolatopsis nigrescens TaxID=381445 RepID=UPI00036A234D|nr:serine/threonine-protein kinase [Amycolatopsis nigrescens]